jgi:hypothetical protein
METVETGVSPALMRLRNKPDAPPRIDFTLYTQEDGTTVSTRDRIIKGLFSLFIKSRVMCANLS